MVDVGTYCCMSLSPCSAHPHTIYCDLSRILQAELSVVYFDQLLGARSAQKLVKIHNNQATSWAANEVAIQL